MIYAVKYSCEYYYADGSLETSTDRNGNQLTITVNGKDTTTRTYDELGRVLTKEVPNIGKTQYIYDVITKVPNGFITEISIDPAGNRTTKVYDRAGRLKTVKVDDIFSESPETVYEYYDNGARKSVTYPGGITEEYTYYANGPLETLKNKKADGTLIDSYKYTYDNAGNQLTKQEYINGVNKGKTTYTYDALNRLETITEPSKRFTKYTYDAAGNRANCPGFRNTGKHLHIQRTEPP